MARRGITLRPAGQEDEPFLCRVYVSTRMDELAVTDWPLEQKLAFLESQFLAQQQHYRTHYTDTEYSVVLRANEQVGRLYVGRWRDEIRIVDIALLPEFRGQGIGTSLIAELLQEARARNVPVRIHVEIFNPARALYDRLGFQQVEDKGVYVLMECSPDQPVSGLK